MRQKATTTAEMYLLGVLIRAVLCGSQYQSFVSNRVEISTPINSWKRVIEGLHLEGLNIDPFTADFFHEQPLCLAAYRALITLCGANLPAVFIVCDMATAVLLHFFAWRYSTSEESASSENKNPLCRIEPEYVALAYLFNPYTVLNCVGCTTTVFSNLFTAAFLVSLTYKSPVFSSLSFAGCLYRNLHILPLVSPLVLTFSSKRFLYCIATVALTLTFWAMLLYCSFLRVQHWEFLNNTYWFVLTIEDLRPNVGIFWYLFAEMFATYKQLFLCSVQMNAFLLYLVPLSIRFRQYPIFLAVLFIFVSTIFKSYPCFGDVGLAVSLLCGWTGFFAFQFKDFLVLCLLYGSTVMSSAIWHLWIVQGSANANFFFGVCLALNLGLIVLLSNMLLVYMIREHTLKFGWKTEAVYVMD